ncbi:MAG TPA: ATP synthase subunit I [Candidatus Kryptonia bacterium]
MIRTLVACLVTIGLVSTVLIVEYADGRYGGSYFLGALLGIVNGVVGFIIIEKFIDKSSLAFLRGVFVGMGVRLLLLLGIFVLLIKVFDRNIVALVTGLLIFYFAMTIFEVVFLTKRIALKKAAGQSAL